MQVLLLESALAAAAWRGARGWESSAARGQRREARGVPTSRTSAPSKVPRAVPGAAKVTAGRAKNKYATSGAAPRYARGCRRAWQTETQCAMTRNLFVLCQDEKGAKGQGAQALTSRSMACGAPANRRLQKTLLQAHAKDSFEKREWLLSSERGVWVGEQCRIWHMAAAALLPPVQAHAQ